MEIPFFYCGIFLGILISHLEAKPFSLNKAIAENSERKLFATLTNTSPENSEETFPLKGALRPSTATQKLKEIGDLLLSNTLKKKRSPLNYKKKNYLKKHKLAKIPTKPRFKRKYPSRREKYDDEGINRRYLPILRSISMLFDDILSTDSQSNEVEGLTPDNARRDLQCSCSGQGDLEPAQTRTRKKTITETPSTQVPIQIETTTAEADTTTAVHLSPFRQNKIIPTLFPRNTSGFRRNFHGISTRDGSPRHRNIKNVIARDRGNSEYDTTEGRDETSTQDNEEVTERDPRYGANSDALRRGRKSGESRESRGRRVHTTTTENTITSQTEAIEDIRGYVNEFERQNSIETGRDTTESTVPTPRNQTESSIYVPGFSERLRLHTTKNKILNHSESLQPKEFYEKGILNVTLGFPGGKRRSIGAGFITEKDQKNRATNSKLDSILSESYNKMSNKDSMVMIIDGYSVARDKNGENQFTKKQYNYIHK